jgi:thioredoxin reductase
MVMEHATMHDVLIVGGSYAGMAAAMALGRSMRDVIVVDAGNPCNRFTPHSHNFLTHDGRAPSEIAEIARAQVLAYPTVHMKHASATDIRSDGGGFVVAVDDGTVLRARKVILAAGIVDELPNIPGLQECWGKSVLHCPYCHGYEVRGSRTALIGHGDAGLEMAIMVGHWAPDLTVLTNGWIDAEALDRLRAQASGVRVDTRPIAEVVHERGHVRAIRFQDGSASSFDVIYAKVPFKLHSDLSTRIACEHTSEGYVVVDGTGRTSIAGVYAAGDCASKMRTVANAVGTGTTVGMQVNRDLVMGDVM